MKQNFVLAGLDGYGSKGQIRLQDRHRPAVN
jgi:hypothetical protein